MDKMDIRVYPVSWIEFLRHTSGKFDEEHIRTDAYASFTKDSQAYAHAQHLSYQGPCVTLNVTSGCGMEWRDGRAKLMRVVF